MVVKLVQPVASVAAVLAEAALVAAASVEAARSVVVNSGLAGSVVVLCPEPTY